MTFAVVIVAVVVIPVVTLVVPLKCALVALTEVTPTAPSESFVTIVPLLGRVTVALPAALAAAISVNPEVSPNSRILLM